MHKEVEYLTGIVPKLQRHCICFHTNYVLFSICYHLECEKRHHYCEWLLAKFEDDLHFTGDFFLK